MQNHIYTVLKYVAVHISQGALRQLGGAVVLALMARYFGVW
jgi:hypothetical protein